MIKKKMIQFRLSFKQLDGETQNLNSSFTFKSVKSAIIKKYIHIVVSDKNIAFLYTPIR